MTHTMTVPLGADLSHTSAPMPPTAARGGARRQELATRPATIAARTSPTLVDAAPGHSCRRTCTGCAIVLAVTADADADGDGDGAG